MNTENLEFEEKFDPALISALYKNFKDPIQAILEITDNAIDDLIPQKQMIITVEIEKDSICIVNKGGNGMGPIELSAFFIWGRSNKRGKLGRYGQGGKAAMGYLGKSWRIRSTKASESEEYSIEELDWDDRSGGLKKYIPKIGKTTFIEEGLVQIDVWKLKRKINKKELKKILSKIYRPLLLSKKIEIISDGNVTPHEFPLERPEERFVFKINGFSMEGWLSVLKDGSNERGGIRCYSFGRLIAEKEFFGQKDPSYKQSIDKLIGEIYIDFEIPLVMNKADFDRGSKYWINIEKEMYSRLDPYISYLLEEKEKDIPSEKEIKAAKYAGDKWKDFLKYLQHIQKEGTLSGLSTELGQKPRENRVQESLINKKEIKETRGPNEPATPPPPIAIGKRKRTGSFPKPVLRALHESIRYQKAEENGEKVILINNKFPVYKLRKNQLPLYMWETLILEYAKADEPDTQNINDYIEEMNNLMRDLAKFIRKVNLKITT